jgi:hypothetical protein
VVALIVAAGFGLLSLLHVSWATTGIRGQASALPERDGKPLFQPGRVTTILVALLLGLACLLVLAAAGLIHPGLSPVTVLVGTWIVAVVMFARAVGDFQYVGFFKRVRGTRFAQMDTRLYSPVALLLGVGTAFVALRA